jgi:hypothetical protein
VTRFENGPCGAAPKAKRVSLLVKRAQSIDQSLPSSRICDAAVQTSLVINFDQLFAYGRLSFVIIILIFLLCFLPLFFLGSLLFQPLIGLLPHEVVVFLRFASAATLVSS